MEKLNLTFCQKRALNALLDKTNQLFSIEKSFNNKDKDINFQAPTGSGKTFIIANYCSKVIEQWQDKYNLYFIFATVSTGELQLQNYSKLKKYRKTNALKYKVEKIESPSNKKQNKNKDLQITINLNKNTVYCIGTSSCTKSSLLYNNGKGKLLEFLQAIRNKKNSKLVYIRDEAHIGVNSTAASSKNLDNLVKNYSDFNVYLSATLDKVKKNHEPRKIDVEIKLIDAVKDHLIKSVLRQNEIADLENQEFNQQQFIDIALNKFVEIRKSYQNAKNIAIKRIRPALLIQIPSANQNSKQDVYNELKNLGLFNKILERNLNYVYYTSDRFETNIKFFPNKFNKEAKELVTRNNSDVDIIIFKVALATGWDIPRACMLLQLRNIDSESLNIQTIGRIRRNPLQQLDPDNNNVLYHEDLIDQYWIYSDNKNAFDQIHEMNNILYLKSRYAKNKEQFQKIRCIASFKQNSSEQTIDRIYQLLNKKNLTVDFKLKTYYDTLINRLQTNDYQKRCSVILSDKYWNEKQDSNSKEIIKYDNFKMSKAIVNIFQLNNLFEEKIDDSNLRNCIYKALEKCLAQKDSLLNQVIEQAGHLKTSLNLNYCLLNLLDVRNQELLQKIKKVVSNTQFENYKYELSDQFVCLPNWTVQEIKTDVKATFENNHSEEAVKINRYLYSNVNQNKTNLEKDCDETDLYFDSANEKYFFRKIESDFIEEIKTNKEDLQDFKFYTKNYIENSDVCFQYKLKEDDSFRIAETYPDFIIKYKDINFFLEIKDMNEAMDYDLNKTKSLIDAYNEFNALQNKTFYSVVKINKDGDTYSFCNTISSNKQGENSKIETLVEFLNETVSFMKKCTM